MAPDGDALALAWEHCLEVGDTRDPRMAAIGDVLGPGHGCRNGFGTATFWLRGGVPLGSEASMRKVTLRSERDGRDCRNLWAYLDEEGRLHIDGQDLGLGTSMVSDDGEYEWFTTYEAKDVPRVVAALDGQPGEDVLDVLERWKEGSSYDLESRLRESGIPSERFVC